MEIQFVCAKLRRYLSIKIGERPRDQKYEINTRIKNDMMFQYDMWYTRKFSTLHFQIQSNR